MVAARRLRTSTVENPSAMVRAGRKSEYRWPPNPLPKPLIGKALRCTLKMRIRMIPSQKPGIAKLSVKKTRVAWSRAPLRRRPAAKPSGNETRAASTALYTTRKRVGATCARMTRVAGSS